MLDDILDYPEDQILPTKFSHSVQNAVVSYLESRQAAYQAELDKFNDSIG